VNRPQIRVDDDQWRYVALAVGCPHCEAEAGEPCYTLDGGDYAPVHGERVEDLRRVSEEGIAVYEDTGYPLLSDDDEAYAPPDTEQRGE
jgi:hypothetical protein